jgi:adenylyltransferase/sulfurtransferase
MAELRITDHTRDRYHALEISSVWELAKIRKARTLVVGAGALGNEVCKNLAMMGVDRIVVLDRDVVEMANLSRSIFFRERDHGRHKTDVMAERLKDVNPDVKVLPLAGDLDSVLGLGLIRRMDVVFSCLDSRLARCSLSRKCEKIGKAWVDGAMEDLLGEVAVYLPGQGPCYECGLSQMQKAWLADAVSCRGIALRNLSIGKVPTTSTMGSIVAALQVQEGVKIIHGDWKNCRAGSRLVINCNLNDFYVTSSERNDDCEGHDQFEAITEAPDFAVDSTTALDLLERFKQDTGEQGFVDLGREVVVEFRCETCNLVDAPGEPLSAIDNEVQRCPTCGTARLMTTTHVAKGDEEYSSWPLSRLGVPRLDILEVRGANSVRWYEMTGDAAGMDLLTETAPPQMAMN